MYPTDSPLRIAALVDDARPINGAYVAVPASLGNLQKLTKGAFPVVSPMEKDGYDWPIKRPWAPLTHQKITSSFLALNPRCFCFNDMGTMKTLSALWAADYLMEIERRAGKSCRTIICCPLSIMRPVWADAIFQHMIGRRSCVVLHGDPEKRRRLLEKPHDFYIINHDGLGVGAPQDRKKLFQGFARDLEAREDIRIAIVDEASVYRDATTKRHRVARALLAGREYLWLMTGTPTPNGPTDAYGLAKLINNANGESFSAYKHRVMTPLGPFKWVPKAGSSAAARQLLQPAVRYAIEDCVNLPPCTVQRRDAEMSVAQHVAYRELKRDAVLMIKASGGVVTVPNQAALRTKLIQIACGAVYDSEHKSHEIEAEPRIRVLEEAIEQARAKVVVFVPLTNVLNMLYKRLSKRWSCAIIKGGVLEKERTSILRDFQRTEHPHILIVDPGAVAHGNDFTAADTEIWYAPTDKNEHWQQGIKRIDRPGQVRNTTIVQIAATPVEREIYSRLENNQSMQGVILKLVEGST